MPDDIFDVSRDRLREEQRQFERRSDDAAKLAMFPRLVAELSACVHAIDLIREHPGTYSGTAAARALLAEARKLQ